MEDLWMKELLAKDAYMGSADKTYEYYLGAKNAPFTRAKFKAALTSFAAKQVVVAPLRKSEVRAIAHKI